MNIYLSSGWGSSWWKKVSNIIEIIVRIINRIFDFMFMLFEAKILGINKNIENGLIVPPVKYSKKLSCKISKIKKIKEIFSANWFFLKK